MFIAALFITFRNWKQSRCSSAEEWIKKMCIKQWDITQLLKICQKIFRQVNGTRKKHLELGNPNTER